VTFYCREPIATVALPVLGVRAEQGREQMAKLRILYGEDDAESQSAPAAAFEKAGHVVEKALGRKAVTEALKNGPFELVVLGPSLSRNDRHHLPYMVKKANEQSAVLVMHADGSRHPYVDACTDTGASVENVLVRIEAMKIEVMKVVALQSGKAAAATAGR
jgi:DNA-binding NtrC family response regulator